MGKVQKTNEELQAELADQIRFLIKSSYAFDQGDIMEAKRLSVTLRNLIKDSRHSKSLLGMVAPSTTLLSYVENHDPQDGTIWVQRNYLIGTLMGNPHHFYLPSYLSQIAKKHPLPVSEWLDEVILTDMEGNPFSRKKIILTVAEQDGGAHVDPTLEADYHALTRKNSQQSFFIVGNFNDGFPAQLPLEALKPAPPPVWHAIRQVAHEVIESMGVKYPYEPSVFYQGIGFGGFGLR